MKKISRLMICFSILSITISAQAQSLQYKLTAVHNAYKIYQNKNELSKAFQNYIQNEPLSKINDIDFTALNILINETKAEKINLYCQANNSIIKAQEFINNQGYCADGVNHLNGTVLRPRVADILTSRGDIYSVTVALKRPSSILCPALENQSGNYLGALVDRYRNREVHNSFNMKEVNQINSSAISKDKKLSMALALCCLPEDNQKLNCIDRLNQVYKSIQ